MRYSSIYTIILALTIAISAWSVVLQPGPGIGKDAYISSSSPDTNYGGLPFMYIGDSGGTVLQSLIQFVELDDYIGYTIDSATLSLYCIVDGVSQPGVTLYIDRITESWDKNQVTWITAPDVAGTPESYAYPTQTDPGAWVDYDVTDFVSNWLDGTYDNYGWLIYTDDNRPHNAYARTCDYSEPNYRPKLEFLNTAVESVSLGEIKAAFK